MAVISASAQLVELKVLMKTARPSETLISQCCLKIERKIGLIMREKFGLGLRVFVCGVNFHAKLFLQIVGVTLFFVLFIIYLIVKIKRTIQQVHIRRRNSCGVSVMQAI